MDNGEALIDDNKIRSIQNTVGSLYRTKDSCFLYTDQYTGEGVFLEKGEIVVLLEYYAKPCLWVIDFYETDTDARVLTSFGMIGILSFLNIEMVKDD